MFVGVKYKDTEPAEATKSPDPTIVSVDSNPDSGFFNIIVPEKDDRASLDAEIQASFKKSV